MKRVEFKNNHMVVSANDGYLLTEYHDFMPIEMYKSFASIELEPNNTNYEYALNLRAITELEDKNYTNAYFEKKQNMINKWLNLNNLSGFTNNNLEQTIN